MHMTATGASRDGGAMSSPGPDAKGAVHGHSSVPVLRTPIHLELGGGMASDGGPWNPVPCHALGSFASGLHALPASGSCILRPCSSAPRKSLWLQGTPSGASKTPSAQRIDRLR